MRLPFLLCTLLLSAPAIAAAQAPPRVHISFGYRYVQAQSINRSDTQHPGLKRLAIGGEVSIAVRIAPVVSLMGSFGRSERGAITVLKGGLPLNSTETGTVAFSVTDLMGGVKFSRAGSGPFVALLAGLSMPGMRFENVSGAMQSVISLDQGRNKSFAWRPMAGIDFGRPSQRAGGRIEAGWDIFPRAERVTTSAVQSVTVTHFRFAASVTIGIGR